MAWLPGRGVLELPGGRRVRGSSLRRAGATPVKPDLVLYLLGRRPDPLAATDRWVPWRDFAAPASTDDALGAIREAYGRAAAERVLVVCRGGAGRTGTALAVMAMLDGMPPGQAVAWVRRHYHRRAVETPGQRRWLRLVASLL